MADNAAISIKSLFILASVHGALFFARDWSPLETLDGVDERPDAFYIYLYIYLYLYR